MTWMGHEAEDEKHLSPEQAAGFQKLADHLNSIAQQIGEPMDPKVEAMLRMAADCIEEQIQLDKYYPWGCVECGGHVEDEEEDEYEEVEEYDTEEPNGTYRFLEENDEIRDEEGPNVTTVERETVIPSAEQLQNWLSNGAPKDDEDDDA